tara:strand:- start:366 stop:572 length:207 start_codon:yes stop_codon:yes gene_type:complete
MSIKIPSINVKTKKTTDTAGKVRRYTPPTRAKLLNKLKKLKKRNVGTSFDAKLKPVLMKNVLNNKKIT